MRTPLFVVFPVAALLLVACSGQVGSSPNLSVAPSPVSLEPGEALAFAATGKPDTPNPTAALRWSVAESGGGTVDASGDYTTPQDEGTFHVVAASTTDAAQKAAVTVSVRRRGIRVRSFPRRRR